MKKNLKVRGLDCANCAAKMESAVLGLSGVTGCRVNFITQKMVLEAPEEQFDAVLAAARKAVRKIEANADLVV